MAGLSIGDLKKTFNDTTIPRYTKLLEMIDAGDKFQIDGKNIDTKLKFINDEVEKLFRSGNLDEVGTSYRGQPVFIGSNQVQYRVTEIFKSPDFGGGKGSGAGAEATAQFESGQCLYASIAWKRKKVIDLNKPRITNEEYNKQTDRIKTTADMKTMLAMTEQWHTSSMLGANLLWKKYGKNGKSYTFHRGSTVVDKIEGAFKRLNRIEKAFGDINKWTPADIYMISPAGAEAVRKLDDAKTLRGLNELMLKYLLSEDIIGVSLKRMEPATAHMKELNVDRTKNKELALTGTYFQVVAESGTSIGDSMDIYAVHSKGKMQFRSFGGTELSGWQGQNAGALAAQGKIALGPINFILRSHGLKELPDHGVSRNFARNPTQAYMTRFWDLVRKAKNTLGTKGGCNKLPATEKEFKKEWSLANDKWKYSKYLCFELIDRMAYIDQKKRDAIMTDLFLYGSSRASVSAPYIKLTSE